MFFSSCLTVAMETSLHYLLSLNVRANFYVMILFICVIICSVNMYTIYLWTFISRNYLLKLNQNFKWVKFFFFFLWFWSLTSFSQRNLLENIYFLNKIIIIRQCCEQRLLNLGWPHWTIAIDCHIYIHITKV